MIRKATVKDKDEVLKIYQEAKKFIKTFDSPQWQIGPPNEESFFADLEKEEIYVNVIEDKIVAVATLATYEPTYKNIKGAWLNDEKAIIIHRIATLLNEQKKGYAKAFLTYINETLKYNNIKIDTHELNLPMKNFLLKNGFILCGEITLFQEFDNKRLAYQKVFLENN